MKKISLKHLIILPLAICIILVIVFLRNDMFKESIVSNAEESVDIVQQIELSLEQAIEQNPALAASSNPYDYIKDNTYYSSLIESGVSVLPTLENILVAETEKGNLGLPQYIIALAIEEISHVSVNEIPQIDNESIIYKADYKSWGSSSEFLEQWSQAKEVTSTAVIDILGSTESVDVKIDELKKFGILAIPEITEYTSVSSVQQRNAASTGNASNAELANSTIPALQQYISSFDLTEEQVNSLYSIMES